MVLDVIPGYLKSLASSQKYSRSPVNYVVTFSSDIFAQHTANLVAISWCFLTRIQIFTMLFHLKEKFHDLCASRLMDSSSVI